MVAPLSWSARNAAGALELSNVREDSTKRSETIATLE